MVQHPETYQLLQPDYNIVYIMNYNRTEFYRRLRTYFNVERVGARKYFYVIYPNTSQDPRRLAGAGFVYQGDGDTVRCLSCRVRFEDWSADDCPVALHARVMPKCQFVTTQLADVICDHH